MKEMCEKIVEKLKKQNKTIAFMESCTGGLLANSITNVSGASEIIKISLVTYSNEYKIKFGVDKNVIEKYTVYSAETAKEMAKNVANFANSNIGVGITGELGNTINKEPKVYYSIYLKDKDEYIYIDKDFNETRKELKEICKMIEKNISYPMFIKPSNSGSSVGINKAKNIEELEKYIEYASKFDKKILIEETLIGREIECSVLGNEDVKASCIGEILPAENFYTFDAKYKNAESKLTIPAEINKDLTDEVRKTAIKAFKAIDGKGFARVDFFVNDKTNEIYINEINTLPGFTEISMYPKLWAQSGLEYSELLDKLIDLALEN